MKQLTVLFLFLLSLTVSCVAQSTFKYDLNNPDRQHQLPEILNEVSGLTDIDSTTVACVQDELGIIFIYDFVSGRIVSQHPFDTIGDFEGLTYTNNAIYILRSDGRLTEWRYFPLTSVTINHYNLSLLTSNNEGLCFDPYTNCIFIAAKNRPLDRAKKEERFIYKYDLATNQLQGKPEFSINVKDLSAKAKQLNIQQPIISAKAPKKPFDFRPSSLSVHPISNEIYIISAADRLLITMDRKGVITQMQQLNPELFPKAEGITFLNDGTMIITNEAAGKKPTLFVFEMRK